MSRTKEMVYLAISVTNGCEYCTASHGAAARKAGMTDAMFGELMAVVGMANETNRLANGYRVPVDRGVQQIARAYFIHSASGLRKSPLVTMVWMRFILPLSNT